MSRRELGLWLVVALAALGGIVWLLPGVDPMAPPVWTVSAAEAKALAVEAMKDLEPMEGVPFITVDKSQDNIVEVRLLEAAARGASLDTLKRSRLAAGPAAWAVTFFDREGTSGRWRGRVIVGTDGTILSARRWWEDEEGGGGLDAETAVSRARQLLAKQGIDLAAFDEPTVRFDDVGTRRDADVRFADRERLLGDRVLYGVAVEFAGSQTAGFRSYVDDPDAASIRARFQSIGLLQQAWVFLPILLLPIVTVPFIRRYHAGEVGVAYGLRIAAVVLAAGIVTILMTAKGVSVGWNFGVLTKPQTAVVVFVQFIVIFYVPMALLAFLSWAVGESLCRQRRPQALAAFDAFLRGEWRNATFARAVVRGLGSGLALAFAVLAAAAFLRGAGVYVFGLGNGGPAWNSVQWFGISTLAWGIASTLSVGLFSELLLLNWFSRHLGRTVGVVGAAAGTTLATFPYFFATPVSATLLVAFLVNLILVGVFLRWGILASLLARLSVGLIPLLGPLTLAQDVSIATQAGLVLLAMFVPLVVSAGSLFSGREFLYRWEDIPPHVRRIAERERQKVELETARNIQSSILPDLPPELNGLEMAHAYQPASEVGGDFYDVLALEDGRLAVAVGDVAGHGVSSGLVMSMAKSALAVQVTFDPEVAAVFRTLNRMVYQSARRRLLATLCYALVDPIRREMFWASAGHLFPYRISADGRPQPLESIAYPLGVRGALEVRTRRVSLEPGDLLFLFSDGVVEARPEGSDEMWGFERLEASLARHAGAGSAHALRDGVLADLRTFLGSDAPLEDDLTVLALRLPAA